MSYNKRLFNLHLPHFKIFAPNLTSWLDVSKSLLIYPASVTHSFSSFSPVIYRSSLRLQLFDITYLPARLFVPEVTVAPNFLGYAPRELPRLTLTLVKSFSMTMLSNFHNSLYIFSPMVPYQLTQPAFLCWTLCSIFVFADSLTPLLHRLLSNVMP